MTPRSRTRGFTLVELMVSVAIVGLLASVAVPQLNRATLRSRAAERLTIMRAIADAVGDVVVIKQGIPGGTWVGVPNPAGDPGTAKRRFDWTASGWPALSMVVLGDTYYTYAFVAKDGSPATLTVTSEGDLDGDGAKSRKEMEYEAAGYAFQLTREDPPTGQEDRTSF